MPFLSFLGSVAEHANFGVPDCFLQEEDIVGSSGRSCAIWVMVRGSSAFMFVGRSATDKQRESTEREG